MSDKKNPILIGEAEVIDLIPESIQKMIDNPGVYLCGDSNAPEVTVPIASMAGKLFSMQIDAEMAPTRFLDTLTIAGPFTKDDK